MREAGGNRILLISGAPGSGKTTLARALAPVLGYALLSKDDIKESLALSLGGPTEDLAYSRRLGKAAMEVLWTLAPRCPRVILEANFRPRSGEEHARIRGLDAEILELYCDCGLDEAARRFAARNVANPHPAHPLRSLPPEMLADYGSPIGLTPVITVDTSGPVAIDDVVQQIERGWQLGRADALLR